MNPQKIYIDTELLVLLVVGTTKRELILKHRRLQKFQVQDYDLLMRIIQNVDQLLLTPNILTEASNLLAQHRDPEKARFFKTLRALVDKSEEKVVPSQDASNNRHFIRLGLTDEALLEVVSKSTPLLTTDLDLYLAATSKDGEAAVNFRHYQ